MRHVVHEVVLHLADALLPDHEIDGDERRDEQDDGEDHGRCHIACHTTNIALLVGEVNDDVAHLSHRIAAEERLMIARVAAFFSIVLASIHLSAVARIDDEVEGQGDAVGLESISEAAIEDSRVEAVLEPLLARLIHDGIDDLVEHALLVDIGFADLLLQVADGLCYFIVFTYRECAKRHASRALRQGVERQYVVSHGEFVGTSRTVLIFVLIEHFLQVTQSLGFL